VLDDQEDLISHKTVSLTMHRVRRFGIRSFHQAEDLAGGLVQPMPQIPDAVGLLCLEVGSVRLGDVSGSDPALDCVNIQEQRHLCPP
jgi:hypothetical protein